MVQKLVLLTTTPIINASKKADHSSSHCASLKESNIISTPLIFADAYASIRLILPDGIECFNIPLFVAIRLSDQNHCHVRNQALFYFHHR